MSKHEDTIKNIMEELNDVLGEHFEGDSELLINLISDSYSNAIEGRIRFIDSENYSLYDDEKEDFEQDGKDLNMMLTGRQKALLEILEKIKNVRKSCDVIYEWLHDEIRKKPENTSSKYLTEIIELKHSPIKVVLVSGSYSGDGMETDLNIPNAFDNKRFE